MLNHSCLPCRARKLKCDGESPCSNCTRRRIENDCHRAPRKARPRKSRRKESTRLSSSSRLDNVAGPSSRIASGDVSIAHDVTPASLLDHDTLFRLAREALRDADTCTTLIHRVFYWRILNKIFACLDLSDVLHDINLIFHDRSSKVESDKIVLCMMVVALSWQYFPKDGSVELKQELNLIDGQLTHRQYQKMLWELSIKYIRHHMSRDDHHTFTQIQTMILLLIYDQTDNVTREQLFGHAQRSAKRLGLHTITMDRQDFIEEGKDEEIKVRAWWFLVTRSWFTSLSTSSYAIHPIHFSTRLPRYLADLDKHPSEAGDMFQSAYSPVQYGLIMITLADMIRKLVDQRWSKVSNFASVVRQEFENYWNELPQAYRTLTDIQDGEMVLDSVSRKMMTERWMLHQLILHAYLELYQSEPLEPMPDACISLAHHILNIQGQVTTFCIVLDSLRINITNVIKACSILALNLMQRPKRDSISRSVVLAQIQQALTNCRLSKWSKPDDFHLISEMLKLEARTNNQTSNDINQYSSRAEGSGSISTEVNSVRNGSLTRQAQALLQGTPNASTVTTSNDEIAADDDLSWTSLLPIDSNLYPSLQANTVEGEWERAYESFLAMNSL